jgi:adenylate cyclase
MPQDRRNETLPELRHRTFDDALGRRIVDTHIWAVREGLRGADAYHLFDGYCQRLVIDGISLWRAHAAMETLHPQGMGMATPGGAISTPSSPRITPTAKKMSGSWPQAPSTH